MEIVHKINRFSHWVIKFITFLCAVWFVSTSHEAVSVPWVKHDVSKWRQMDLVMWHWELKCFSSDDVGISGSINIHEYANRTDIGPRPTTVLTKDIAREWGCASGWLSRRVRPAPHLSTGSTVPHCMSPPSQKQQQLWQTHNNCCSRLHVVSFPSINVTSQLRNKI